MKTTKVCRCVVLSISLALISLALFPANAGQVTLPVDSSTSTLSVSLCADPGIGQDCDSDSASVLGHIVVSLDDNNAPGQIALRDFDLQASRSLSLRLSWIFGVASLDASADNLAIAHANPGEQNPFFPVLGQAFNATNVPCQTRGVASYSANNLACTALQNMDMPCVGAFDLSTNGTTTVDTIPGTVWVSDGMLHVHVELSLTNYLNEANPSMGTIVIHGVVNASAPISGDLVSFDSFWRYLDNGTDPGATWYAVDFNDSAWPSGPAQLGYGEGDEATINSYGPDPANKYITTYYRHAFDVANPGVYENLLLRLLRDDGAVVYLNNQEIFRSNMPEGPIAANTLAVNAVAGTEETIYFAKYIEPGLLVQGRNVVAVEVHQVNVTSSDLSFALALQGNVTGFSNQLPSIAITSPNNGVALNTGFNLEVNASDPDGVIALVEFFQDGMKIGQSLASPWTFTVPPSCPGTFTFSARAWDNSGSSIDAAPVQINVVQSGPALVAQGSVWKYLDNGSDQGTAWRGLTFNDTAWSSGRAELGYGDGGEATTNSFGPDANNKYVTTYYRQKFTVTNLNMMGMVLHLLRDDGAVVYLNSNEVFRSNLPIGPIAYNTYAMTNLGAPDETTFIAAAIPTNYLTLGINQLAVEIHQASSNSTDISFDLELNASYPNQPPQIALITPANGAEIPAGMPLRITAAATDPENSVARVDFYEGTTLVGFDLVAPYELELSSYPSGRYLVTAVAYDNCGLATTSAVSQVSIGAFSMISPGAVWKYRDNGMYPGGGWVSRTYSDATWLSGRAEFGYGDGDEATVNQYGPYATNKYITTWFRHAWTVPDKSLIAGLTVRLLRDDGAVVYLNATEVFRSNMPEGPITASTLALAAVAGAEETTWFTRAISPSLLQNGTNVLAVEIHQSSSNSTDISFNLELIATVNPAYRPEMGITQSAEGVTLRWPTWAVGFKPYQTHNLAPPIQWQPVPGTFSSDNAWRTLPVSPDTNVFYRLSW